MEGWDADYLKFELHLRPALVVAMTTRNFDPSRRLRAAARRSTCSGNRMDWKMLVALVEIIFGHVGLTITASVIKR